MSAPSTTKSSTLSKACIHTVLLWYRYPPYNLSVLARYSMNRCFYYSEEGTLFSVLFFDLYEALVMNKYDEEGAWVYTLYDEQEEYVTEFLTYADMRLYVMHGILN